MFLIGIGGALSHGERHDVRAPDYDDWSSHSELGLAGLNGDILVWNPVLQDSFEISSMGIRSTPRRCAVSWLSQATRIACSTTGTRICWPHGCRKPSAAASANPVWPCCCCKRAYRPGPGRRLAGRDESRRARHAVTMKAMPASSPPAWQQAGGRRG